MTNEELVELIQQNINVQENMEKLYIENKNFIHKIVLPYSKTIEIEDLMQEAYFGLYKAALKFSNDKDAKFLTYAHYYILNSVNRYRKNCGKLKKIPEYTITLISKYHKFINDYRNENKCEPSDIEIMEHLKINQKQFERLKKYIYEDKYISLQSTLNEDFTLEDTLASDSNIEDEVCEKLLNQQLKQDLWNEVDKLPDKMKDIIKQRYKNNKPQKDIANNYNMSCQRISQIECEGLKILKQKEKLKNIAKEYYFNTSVAYSGGFKSFKNNGGSVVENLVIRKIENEKEIMARIEKIREKRKKLIESMSM